MSAVTLVTGATGLIGRHLVRQLVADGVPTRVLARRPELLPPTGWKWCGATCAIERRWSRPFGARAPSCTSPRAPGRGHAIPRSSRR